MNEEEMYQRNRDLQNQMNALQGKYDQLYGQTSAMGNLREDNRGLTKVTGGRNRMGQVRPDYISMTTSDGQLDHRFKQTLGQSYSTLRDQLGQEGDLESTALMRQQLGMQTAAQRDAIAQQQAGATAQAREGMAMRGGLRGGAAERLGQAGVRQSMLGQQQLGRDYNLQNLGLSLQDANTRVEGLKSLGGVEQNIQSANINRFQQDLENQNRFLGSIYSEDAQALAAERSAQAQSSASCFKAGTMVEMVDGTEKAIEEIKVGDVCKGGGEVYFTSVSKANHIYDYRGVKVTGTHAVHHGGSWVRVADIEEAVYFETPEVVYCLANENHLILINGITFSDFHETDNSDDLNLEESIKALNGEL